MMQRNDFRIITCILFATVVGCGGDQSAETAAAANLPGDVPSTTEYPLRGEVKRVEIDRDHVTIAHEAIPGFMDAMRMRFAYKDKNVLTKLTVGDVVEGTLRVDRAQGAVRDYELLRLRVLKPAPPPAADPDISRKKALTISGSRLLKIGETVPDFTMTDQNSHSVKLSDLRGNVVALTFIYTRCPLPDFCPLMDKKFSELAARIAPFPERAGRIRLISLSFDPAHDTPDVLKKHAQMRGATPPLWTYAVATHPELAKIGAALGLFYQPGDSEIAHNLTTAVIDTEGKLARLEIGTERNKWDSTDLRKTLYSLLPTPAK